MHGGSGLKKHVILVASWSDIGKDRLHSPHLKTPATCFRRAERVSPSLLCYLNHQVAFQRAASGGSAPPRTPEQDPGRLGGTWRCMGRDSDPAHLAAHVRACYPQLTAVPSRNTSDSILLPRCELLFQHLLKQHSLSPQSGAALNCSREIMLWPLAWAR